MYLFNHKTGMALFCLALSLLLFCSNESASGQNQAPRFEDYPVAKIYKGKKAALKINREEKRLYGERLRYTIKHEAVDFAGHYIVANWSCGMWCNWSAVIDAKTGRVYWWNGILSFCFPDLDKDFACNENFDNVEYRIDSKLIVFFGRRNDTGVRGFHYYKFENGRFIHLKSISVKEQRTTSEIQTDKSERKIDKNQKP
ncbi:MAG: hypothetical protein JSS81_28675 [Acidobacteria bacterium]|nr:hypothetical protein [Acidobacteriota bacterium]